jgi:hypothetical protein
VRSSLTSSDHGEVLHGPSAPHLVLPETSEVRWGELMLLPDEVSRKACLSLFNVWLDVLHLLGKVFMEGGA